MMGGMETVHTTHDPLSAIVVPKFGVHPTYSFGDIAILRFGRFASKLPIHMVISAAHAHIQR